MGSAQPGPRMGGQALAGRHRAGAQARPGAGGGMIGVAVHEGVHALTASAPQAVAAGAQVVGPDRPLEAGSPADQAQPVTGAVRAARAGLAEGLDAGPASLGETLPAPAAQAAGAGRLQLAARDPAYPVAEQRMVAIWGQCPGWPGPTRLRPVTGSRRSPAQVHVSFVGEQVRARPSSPFSARPAVSFDAMSTPVPSMTAYSLSGTGDGGSGTTFREVISPERSRTAAACAAPLASAARSTRLAVSRTPARSSSSRARRDLHG